MKNTRILILALLILPLAACDVLDVAPYHSIPEDQAITNRADVESAITGVYSSLQAVGYYGRNYLVAGDLAADNLTWTGTTAGYNQIDNNTILADNVIVEGIWSAIYNTIHRANYVIEALPAVVDEDVNMTAEDALVYEAELLFIRAMAHFDLARMFGPVPIRTAVASSSEEDLNVPRMPLGDVYEQIFIDLEVAAANIGETVVRGKASRAAVLAMKARASLYYYSVTGQTNYLQDAVQHATEVIDDFGLELVSDFATLFEDAPNGESIFEVNFGEQDRNRLAEYFFPTSLSGRREFAPTMHLFNLFESADARRDASIAMDGTNLYGIKYNDIQTGTDNVYLLRLAEMHLLRAEALVLLEQDLTVARDDINAVRTRAGLAEIITTTPFLLQRQVRNMRQLEFAFEGHRWFDLVRTGLAIEELENVHDDYQYLFPIPLGELLTNTHEGMYQNPGYE